MPASEAAQPPPRPASAPAALPEVRLGVATETGRRARNEDVAAACLATPGQRATHGIVAAIADGMGGAKGGRVAAEVTVRGFLDDYYAQPATLGVERAAAQVLAALNRWICAQGATDPALAGMATTFSALILLGSRAHVVHVGDSRIYRWRAEELACLTEDHTLKRPELSHVLYRAIGIEDALRLDHAVHVLRPHDRFLLCTDGVHGVLAEREIAALLAARQSPEETARSLTAAALAAGGRDNATALVLDVLAVPPPDRAGLESLLDVLPLGELPRLGARIDDFRLERVLADGRNSRLFRAIDERTGRPVVLKFPHPRLGEEPAQRAAFLREAWVAAHLRSPWLGEVLDFVPERRSRLYAVMPWYEGESLEQRLRRPPPLGLEEGIAIGLRLAKAAAALHRAGVVHRDIKPDNVLLERGGGLRLLDFGIARIKKLEEGPPGEVPGTPSYMAPELFAGASGDERSDIFALGVTLYRAFSGAFPYGEIEPFSRPRFGRPAPLARHRPDLPAWLDEVLTKAVAVDPAARFADMLEFAFALDSGPRTGPDPAHRRPLYARNPLLFWQALAAALFLLVLALLARSALA